MQDGCARVPPIFFSNVADSAGYVPAMGDGFYVTIPSTLGESDHEYTKYISFFDHATGSKAPPGAVSCHRDGCLFPDAVRFAECPGGVAE